MDALPFDTLRQSAKPVVAAVNGLCQGGGLQIALCADMAVVSDRATFRVPELYRGIADTYYSHMLARLIGPVRTRDLMFTGRTLSAPRRRWTGAWSRGWCRTTICPTPPAKCWPSAAAPRPAPAR